MLQTKPEMLLRTAHTLAVARDDRGDANVTPGTVLGRIGSLEARLAETAEEIDAAQRLRYEVFFRERGRADAKTLSERDADLFDDICDHLIVVDTARGGDIRSRLVGTYRLLPPGRVTGAPTGSGQGYYSADEFDVATLVSRHPRRRFLELGRSCVISAYRSKRTAELLWQGIWAYARAREIDVMMGCASFPGTVPAAHALALGYLHHNHGAEAPWQTRARPERFVDMDLMPSEAIGFRDAINAMPPLIKGYLRLGAMVAEGCVIDHDFGTTDIFIVLPIEVIPDRYIRYYTIDG